MTPEQLEPSLRRFFQIGAVQAVYYLIWENITALPPARTKKWRADVIVIIAREDRDEHWDELYALENKALEELQWDQIGLWIDFQFISPSNYSDGNNMDWNLVTNGAFRKLTR